MRLQAKMLLYAFLVAVAVLGAAYLVRGLFGPKAVMGVLDTTTVLAEHPEMIKAERLLTERKRVLQSELDRQIRGLSERGQQKAREEYQIKLDNEAEGLRNKAVSKIRRQIAEYARSIGLEAVFDSKAVLYGGVDITRDFLGIRR